VLPHRLALALRLHAAEVLGLVVVLLAIGAGGVLAAEEMSHDARGAMGDEFQQLVGGLGFGPTVDVSQCPFGFDPRLEADCRANHGPIPGGVHFCPLHAGSVWSYPPLEPPELPEKVDRDAHRP
jgi:hypothetical protein